MFSQNYYRDEGLIATTTTPILTSSSSQTIDVSVDGFVISSGTDFFIHWKGSSESPCLEGPSFYKDAPGNDPNSHSCKPKVSGQLCGIPSLNANA